MSDEMNDNKIETIKSILKLKGVRFPVATIAKDLKVDAALVSNYLSGKKQISDKFFNKFLAVYGIEGDKDIVAKDQDLGKTIGKIIEEIAKLRSEVNVLNQTIDLILSDQTKSALSIVSATRRQAVLMEVEHILAELRKKM
jgi:transcriptional regulator with XRE-family HTH domain